MEDDQLYPDVPEDLSALTPDELSALATELAASVAEVSAAPNEFVSTEVSASDLLDATKAAVASLAAVKAELASRETPEEEPEGEDAPEGDEAAEEAVEVSDEAAAEFLALAEAAAMPDEEDTEDEPVAKTTPKKKGGKASIVASVTTPGAQAPMRNALPRPVGDRAPRETRPSVPSFSLVAGAGASGELPLGYEFRDMNEVSEIMVKRRYGMGPVPEGHSEKECIARMEWKGVYPEERTLKSHPLDDGALVAAAVNPKEIRARFDQRKRAQIENPMDMSLVASGGLCNPVTPYYQLQMISTPMRPVQAALPSFGADRGGIRYMPPAGLGTITTGVGLITAAQDGAGPPSSTKTCQTITCNNLVEVDVDIIYHCLQFGNLQARAFPEQVTQMSETTLAGWARLAEANLLTQISNNSTQVTAGSLGLGASASLFSQILAAANGQRSRNRMDPTAILRLLMPFWAVDLIISDVIRTQFERFDTDEAQVVALLRSFDIEPTFYLDSATSAGQVFGTQANNNSLNTFPSNVVWYLFPEGSHLYLDGGVLELGIVRDSVLNANNNFQLFGEGFENAAFVGIESLAVTSAVCDNGAVSLPKAADPCPYSYSQTS